MISLELPIPNANTFPNTYSEEIINDLEFYSNNYKELPSNDKIIKTWYESDWVIKKADIDPLNITPIKGKIINHLSLLYNNRTVPIANKAPAGFGLSNKPIINYYYLVILVVFLPYQLVSNLLSE